MKLKELPISWWASKKLTMIPVKQLAYMPLTVAPVIVSLTSIPSRLDLIHITIRSLLTQSLAAKKVILWLNDSLKLHIPKTLNELQSDRFEIKFRSLNCPHRKLIFCLDEYPETDIVTCDDDVIYEKDWLKKLYQDHLIYPKDIIAHECRIIKMNSDGSTQEYRHWSPVSAAGISDPWLMPIGYGGVYYPSRSLHSDVTDQTLFLDLTPRADDLWFKSMAILAGTRTRRASTPAKKPIPIIGSQKESLQKSNVKGTGNHDQWVRLNAHYDLYNRISAY
jgi:Glycosyl transferase family 2